MRQSKCQSNNKPTKPPKGQKTSCKKLNKKKDKQKSEERKKKLKEKCHKASIVKVNLKFAVRVLQVCKGASERGREDTPVLHVKVKSI